MIYFPDLLCFRGHRFKAFIIILMKGIHQAVPPGEIQPVIPFEILVMHIVVDRGIEPLEEPVTVEAPGKQLKAQVAINIIDRHEDQERKNMDEMYRECKGEDINDPRFDDGFRGLKGKGSPG